MKAIVRNNRFYILAAGALLFGVLFLFLRTATTQLALVAGYDDGVLKGDRVTIAVSIADTEAEREQGLSGTTPLPDNAGKLFVFDAPGSYGFWMKDMSYGLDFIWLDADMRVLGVTPDISPDTYPQVFYPPADISYALEVASGFSTAHGITTGQSFTLEK